MEFYHKAYLVFLVLCHITCTISEEVTADQTCSTDGECMEKTDMYSRIVPTELPAETQEVLHTIATLEMYRAQREVANYLELAYLQLADHPEQAKEVRLTAHSARTQHLMTSGLMKKFTVTAAHIVNTMIPMILDAVVELQSAAVVKEIFGQIIKTAEEMKTETEATQQRYMEIQTEVQKNMASVTSRNKEVVSEKERIRVEMEREKQLAKAAKLAQEELDEEKQKMEEELTVLKSNRDKWMEQAGHAGRSMGEEKTVFDSVLSPGAALGGGIGGVAVGLISAGVNFFTGLFRSDKRQKHFHKLMDAYRESQNSVERVMGQKRDVIGRMHEQRKEALERLSTLKKLGMETANLGNVESLREAHAQLGNVDRQFTRIIEFWSNMAAALKALRDESTSGSVYLSQIENPKHAERFKASIGRAEKGWKFFGRICSDYVQESDTEIYTLYNFLSAPIDSMAASARAQRQQEVLLAIEADIENTYPDPK
ncbi:uncharacterized protein LOC123546645 isoform X1 [Mercenaria mercenaria]|uniref:uncharacterized protein LOC123546645 isoform X1 n=1 Tax=Mercenaria mercenaria TaxID=6596 RepID=UPI00234E6ABA|nr:uncharacterized protein LOC123546645 isoform X1 [Mercenaria mercenaria]